MTHLLDILETTNGSDPPDERTLLGPRWTLALKLHLLLIWIALPFGIAWATWQTSDTAANESFRTRPDQFTAADARELETRIRDSRDQLATSIDARLDSIEQQTARIVAILERLERSRN